MSKYAHEPLNFQGLKTVPIQARGGKVCFEHFAKPYAGGGVSAWLDSLPHILAADSLRSVADALAQARERKKMILWGTRRPCHQMWPRAGSDRSDAARVRDRVRAQRRFSDPRF
jgi:hypothetical protein